MMIDACHEKETARWQELIEGEVLVFFTAAVTAIEFIDRRVVDAQRTVGRDEFISDDEIRHVSTVEVGSVPLSGSLRWMNSLKEFHVSPGQRRS